MPCLRMTSPLYQTEAFLEAERLRTIDRYTDDHEDGERPLTRTERRADYFDLFGE